MSSDLEEGKKAAARKCVEMEVKQGMTLGIGSGSTIVHVVSELGRLLKEGGLVGPISCVPTSFQAKMLILSTPGLRLADLEEFSQLDLVIGTSVVTLDGADEFSPDKSLIKGGGGCQTREKIVASCGKRFVVVVDYSKKSEHLGQNWQKGIPLEVIPFAQRAVTEVRHLVDAAGDSTVGRSCCSTTEQSRKDGPCDFGQRQRPVGELFDSPSRMPSLGRSKTPQSSTPSSA